MRARDVYEHMRTQTPFVVYGDAIIFQPVKEETRDPHDWYRVKIKRGDIAVNMCTLDEFEARHKSRFERTLDETRQANLEQALQMLKKVRDAHWEFYEQGQENILDPEFWDGVEKVLDFFCLVPKPSAEEAEAI